MQNEYTMTDPQLKLSKTVKTKKLQDIVKEAGDWKSMTLEQRRERLNYLRYRIRIVAYAACFVKATQKYVQRRESA